MGQAVPITSETAQQVPVESSAPSLISELGTSMALNAGIGAVGTLISTGINISTSLKRIEIQRYMANTQKIEIEHQETMATNAAENIKELEQEKRNLINGWKDKDGAKHAGLVDIQKAVNESAKKRAEAEGKLAQTKVAIKEAKKTEKAGKLDTRRLDAFFDPRDVRFHGRPTVVA